MSEAKTTTDHNLIRKWAESRGAKPASVQGTGKKDEPGILRLDFDPKRIDPSHVFDADMTRYLDWFQDGKVIPGQAILTPGEPERLSRAKRAESGLPLPDETWASIVAAATSR